MKGYPIDELFEEVAFLAYYFHWEYGDLMYMPHQERRRWCDEAGNINKKLNNRNEKVL